jgi:hypothetical protein
VREDAGGHLDSKVGEYVDSYVKSPMIRKDLQEAIFEFCRNDAEFVAQVRKIVGAIIDDELRQAVEARLHEVKVGDKSFTDWLVRVAIKESLTSEAVRVTIESTVKAHIEEVMRRVLATGLTGLSGK